MYTVRLFLVLALALSVSAEAQSSRRAKKSKKPAVTKPAPVPEEPAAEPEPAPEPEATAATPEEPPPEPLASPVDTTVVLAVARTPNAELAASQIEEELTRLLSAKADVHLVDLVAAFPVPEPASMREGDKLFEEGKSLYDNLDPEAAVGKFEAAAEFYQKHPGALNPERLARTYIFMGASHMLNGDMDGTKRAFLRALAASPETQPESALFGSDVQTAFTDAQQEFTALAKGTLAIESKPSGARVSMRGEELGVTPLKDVEVHPGRHPIVISLPGHLPFSAYPQVAPGKSEKLEASLQPLPGLGELREAAARAATERVFGADTLLPEATLLAEKVGARYVVLAAVQQRKSDPAEAELQVWDVRTKNRLRGVELEHRSRDRDVSAVAAADRIHGFLTGAVLPTSATASGVPAVMKKPWFWAAVVGGAAVVTGGILYATQDRGRRPGDVISGIPGLGF